ncbi:hypothetical protein [Leptothoe sp. PORK10 BA2]|uniref:hypothetical protein n=1 Tax=Leptothoe sp. PORK10 BA2 TaxID=3110254 RepID=UPI002B209808|nr:hypothetical protein [Leptothoe sp. PORK10 BA2]MEA5464086.1 hypothetical protein [Leptothoe sp. PORK10 BA2]
MRLGLFNLLALSLVISMIASCQQQNTVLPSPSSTTGALDINQPVPLAVGQTQDFSGTLKSNETIHFLLIPQSGQRMTVALEGTGVQMAILDQDSRVLEEKADLKEWQGVATYSGQYFVRLIPIQSVERSEYKISLGLKAN